jgi:hypothetical protein
MTDAFGCYEDFYVATRGGAWEATTFYSGDECSGPGEQAVHFDVPLKDSTNQDRDGPVDGDEQSR